MTCPATLRVGGFFGPTIHCTRKIGHKGAHEAGIPDTLTVWGTAGKWVARITVR